MPRFFIHLYNSEVLCDERGEVFKDLQEARLAARAGAAELIGEHIANGTIVDLDDRLEVTDEEGRLVFVLKFADFFKGGAASFSSAS